MTAVSQSRKLIHIAQIFLEKKGKIWLFLRQIEPFKYVWYKIEQSQQEQETTLWGANTEEAIFLARRHWRNQQFTPLNCGFRYTLPERDEIGTNALFHQMGSSYTSMNGIYFEPELGINCIVHNAPLESRQFWEELRQQGKL